MRINGTSYESLRPGRSTANPMAGQAAPVDGAPPTGHGTPSPLSPKSDSVQFSDIGKAMSASQSDELSPERVQELRAKVMQGAYNSLDVVEQVARRVLDSGDL
jgi:anti-sigma28 factor (negative regulator of flagellin synthesis)